MAKMTSLADHNCMPESILMKDQRLKVIVPSYIETVSENIIEEKLNYFFICL